MLEKPNFKQFRTSEYAQFMTDVVKIATQKEMSTLGIEAQVLALAKSATKLVSNLNMQQGSNLTETIINYDNRRDKSIVCFRTMALAFTNHYDVAKIEAGEKLLKLVDSFGTSISRFNYQAETSTINAICLRINTDASLTENVTLLGMTEILDELNQANQQFNDLYLSRVQNEAGKQDQTAGELYRTLENHIVAHQTINPSECMQSLINEINQLIEKYNTTIEARYGNKEEVKAEEVEEV